MKREESGMALVEAILLGLVLVVPLLWMLGMLDHVHRAALGASTAAREAGFAVAAAEEPGGDGSLLRRSVALAMRDQGLEPSQARVDLSVGDGGQRAATVRVEVRYPVPMLDVPLLGRLPSVWVTARHVAAIDRYRTR